MNNKDNKLQVGTLTRALKDKYREVLKTNPALDFGEEFIRTTDLERKLINAFGFDAIKLIFEYRKSKNYYNLGSFPKECPWFELNDLSTSELIKSVFKPIKKEVPNLVKALKKRCEFIYVEKKENTWKLHYLLTMKLYDDRKYYKVYIGGEPKTNCVANENLKKYDWVLPEDLKTFYAVHNGFGDEYAVLANSEIKIMAEMMDPICKEQNNYPKGYKFNKLLDFLPDGSGNSQCFRKNKKKTVDWDHETWELSNKENFFSFIDDRMSIIDEEQY